MSSHAPSDGPKSPDGYKGQQPAPVAGDLAQARSLFSPSPPTHPPILHHCTLHYCTLFSPQPTILLCPLPSLLHSLSLPAFSSLSPHASPASRFHAAVETPQTSLRVTSSRLRQSLVTLYSIPITSSPTSSSHVPVDGRRGPCLCTKTSAVLSGLPQISRAPHLNPRVASLHSHDRLLLAI
ncbi:hypothetical protein K402DRAFT_110282 [Aulographum hederae CBS 113979]|uniref:Uncharacterized protein n=1 Tax=Aulographum hederae CBS 113979 TaxID=1176131 RepID=A0A6G1GX08_9PEZI|nr:hypothetical protein K402DRAFT_110282 [Aulographum hederae CBS 113979]